MKSRLVDFKQYVAGWLDSTIHDFLPDLPAANASIQYALITCLDSHPEPAKLRSKSPELKCISKKLEVVGTGLLVPTEVLLQMDSTSRLFFGFDEIWFFPSKEVQPMAHARMLVGPARLNRDRLKKCAAWMAENNCSLGLGGGEGLNFVVKALGLVKPLLGHSIEQPAPTFATA